MKTVTSNVRAALLMAWCLVGAMLPQDAAAEIFEQVEERRLKVKGNGMFSRTAYCERGYVAKACSCMTSSPKTVVGHQYVIGTKCDMKEIKGRRPRRCSEAEKTTQGCKCFFKNFLGKAMKVKTITRAYCQAPPMVPVSDYSYLNLRPQDVGRPESGAAFCEAGHVAKACRCETNDDMIVGIKYQIGGPCDFETRGILKMICERRSAVFMRGVTSGCMCTFRNFAKLEKLPVEESEKPKKPALTKPAKATTTAFCVAETGRQIRALPRS